MKSLGILLALLATLHSVRAVELRRMDSSDEWQQSFDKGEREISAGAGIFISPFGATHNRPTENYAGPIAQIGYMLNSLGSDVEGWRGNFEVAGELFGGGIFKGKGHYVGNATFWLRYNLIPPHCKLVPYFQVGAGVTFTDADQSSFGQVFNFNEGVAVGVRYFITPRCSVNGEYRLHHISNAGLAEHNLGINAQGAVVSVSWYF